ncbi:MAG: NADH-quinone oxidoreductase subunit NuoE [Elusimicrobia bacterium]|nr:NADH-quinone oxidoreductase subunit NuoE [Elusimicrobiota bacterium]
MKDIFNKYEKKDENILGLLEDIQTEFNYLSEENIRKVAEAFGVPLSRIFGISTFYKSFSLTPKGKHIIWVCSGTACHVRGAPKISDRLTQLLGIEPGGTTPDNQFTLETVNCLGACALGPLVVIDGKYHGKMSVDKIEKLLQDYK